MDEALARANALLTKAGPLDEPASADLAAVIGASQVLVGLCQSLRDEKGPARGAFSLSVRLFDAAGEALLGHGDYIADRGIALQQVGAHDEAEGLLRQALDLGEDTPDVRRHLGACMLDQGQVEEAVSVLDDAVRRAPLDWQAHVLRARGRERLGGIGGESAAAAWLQAGHALEVEGLLYRAVRAYRRAVDVSPTGNPDVLAALGRTLVMTGQPGDAIEVLEAALETNPQAELHVLAARALYALERYDEALRHTQAATSLSPGSAETQAVHAAALYQVGDFPEALATADRALENSEAAASATAAALSVRGSALLELGRYSEAVEALRIAAKVSNSDSIVLANLGHAYWAVDDPESARAAFDQAIDANPNEPSYYLSRANLSLDQEDPAAARRDLEQLVQLMPDNPYALGQLASVLDLVGEVDLALERIEQALALDPNWLWALTKRGDILIALQRLPEAVESYRQVLNIRPDAHDAIIGIADVLLTEDAENLDEIDGILEKALKADPDSPPLHAFRGEVLRRHNQPVEALDALNRAVELKSDYAYAHATRGQVLSSLGRTDEAIADLANARDLAPDQAWIRVELARQFRSAERLAEAQAELAVAVELEPENGFVRAQLGEIAAQNEDQELAVQELRHATELAPEAAWIWSSLAEALRIDGRPDEALGAAARALHLNPESVDALLTRGQILYQTDRFEESTSAFEEAVRLRPNVTWIRSALGESYRCLGRLDAAIATVDQVLEDDPGNVDALITRGAARRLRGDLEPAITDLLKAWELDPTSLFTFSNLRLALSSAGRADEAIKLFRHAPEGQRARVGWQREYAETLHAAGRHRKALSVLDNALWSHPSDVATIRALGWILTNLGRYEEAVSTFRRALTFAPENPDVLTDMAEPLARSGRYLEALGCLEQAIKLRPDDGSALMAQCLLLADVGEWGRAAAAGRAAVRTRAVDPSAYVALAWAAEHLEFGAEEALDAAEHAVKYVGTARWGRKARANALWLLDRVSDARTDYRWVLDNGPSPGQADFQEWALRGWCHFRLGELESAADAYSQSLRLAGVRSGLFFDLGLALFCAGEDDRGEDAYARGLAAAISEGELRARGAISVALHDLRLAARADAKLLDREPMRATNEKLAKLLSQLEQPEHSGVTSPNYFDLKNSVSSETAGLE